MGGPVPLPSAALLRGLGFATGICFGTHCHLYFKSQPGICIDLSFFFFFLGGGGGGFSFKIFMWGLIKAFF